MTRTQRILSEARATRIVRQPQGSWRWQTPYSVVEYRVTARRDGLLIWKVTWKSHKMTPARIRKFLGALPLEGGLHNQPVSLRTFPPSHVQHLRNHGFYFGAL